MKYLQVEDDRGIKRRMASPVQRRRGRQADPRSGELRALQFELWMRSLWGQVVFWFLLFDLAVLFVLGLLLTVGGMSRGDPASPQGEVPYAIGPMSMGIGGVIGGPLGWGRWRRHKRGPDHWRTWLDACRRCPACEYDLAGLDPEPDNCLVCPECGGAWRLVSR